MDPPDPGSHSYPSSNNIRAMQLFYELKRIHPAIPDTVVSNCLREADYDRETALALLTKVNVIFSGHLVTL